MRRREVLIILLIFLLGIVFRLYKISDFSYWSDDEQQQWYMLSHIIKDKHPSLVMPNAALGIGLNPIYHYLLIPFYLFSKFNPLMLQGMGLIFFLANFFIIYLTGKLLGGAKTGYIVIFLYSISFTASLFDRRLWALSPNFFVISLTLFAILKLFKKKYRYFYLLTASLILSFSSDPSLGIVFIPILFVFLLIYKKLPKNILIKSIIIVLIFLSPLLMFELRHNFQNSRSLFYTFSESRLKNIRNDVAHNNFIKSQIENFSRFFYLKQTDSAESIFCYCFLDDNPPFFITFIIAIFLVLFLIFYFRSKRRDYLILIIFLTSYFLGKYLFQSLFKGYPVFFYSIVISPVLFLIVSQVLSKLPKFVTALILLLFFIFNFKSLINSNFKYPLSKRMNLANIVQDYLNKNNVYFYSLYYSGDIMLSGSGFNSIFDYYGNPPNGGSLYLYWGHLYESYELYKDFSKDPQRYIVVISENNMELIYKKTSLFTYKIGNLKAFVFDNSKKWFLPEAHLEKLYQPKYF